VRGDAFAGEAQDCGLEDAVIFAQRGQGLRVRRQLVFLLAPNTLAPRREMFGDECGRVETSVRQELQYAWWISREAGGIFLLPVISVVGLTLAALMRSALRRSWRPYYWLVLTHLLFFVAAVALGTLGAADGPVVRQPVQPNRAASLCVDILFWTSFASCTFWIWRMKGFRWFGVGFVGAMQIFVLLAFLVAGMSVSGDWL
jgi:hypothetical protein